MTLWNDSDETLVRGMSISANFTGQGLASFTDCAEQVWEKLAYVVRTIVDNGVEDGDLLVTVEFWLENGTIVFVPRVDREIARVSMYSVELQDKYCRLPEDDSFDVKAGELIRELSLSVLSAADDTIRRKLTALFPDSRVLVVFRDAEDKSTETQPVTF